MDRIHIHDKFFVPFLGHDRISAAIDKLADKLNSDFVPVYGTYARPLREDVPIALCVMNGASLFTTELLCRLKFPVELTSIKVSSYVGTRSSGKLDEVHPLVADVKGRTVIICEDIVDTGVTIVGIREMLYAHGAAEVLVCTLLLKPEVFKDRLKLDYVGLEIPNAFVVGFGLDYNELGRNLKDIYVLDDSNKKPMKYFIIFGPPGAGKGTHAAPIAEKYGLKHISTGELLRSEIAAGTALGKKAKALIDDGNLVPDEVVEGMIANAFAANPGVNGFLLDGFPRTIQQAMDLDEMLESRDEEVTGVLSLMIPDSEIKARIQRRALIEGRADDASEQTIENRIKTYHALTEPLIEVYKEKGIYHEVDSLGSIEEVQERVFATMDEL